jgi:hypothetical protein
MAFSKESDPRLYKESLFVARKLDYRISIGELGRVLDGQHYKVTKQEMARRLQSDLK